MLRRRCNVRLTAEPLDLELAAPFRIARSVQREAHNVLVRIEADGMVGIGEAAPKEFYGETRPGALAALDLFADELGDNPAAFADITSRLYPLLHRNAAAMSAVDMVHF